MDLSPNDIRNYEFTTQMRGYSRDEVDGLLEQVAAALEAVKQENLKLSMEVDSVKTQLTALRQFEDTIKSAAIDARRNADMTVANAKQEAELILGKARAESEKILETRVQTLSDLEAKITAADMTKKSYLNKVRSVITSHLEIIDELLESESADKEGEDIEVTQSSEVERKKMETVGTPSVQDKPSRREEANAADKIVEARAEPDAGDDDEDQPDADSDEAKPIDPELAVALEKYQTRETEAASATPTGRKVTAKPLPPLGQLIETTARAGDIPDGFIAGPLGKSKGPNPEEEVATDKFNVGEAPPKASTEETAEAEPSRPPTSAEDLAKELDKVVAKFEEEMDKAARL